MKGKLAAMAMALVFAAPAHAEIPSASSAAIHQALASGKPVVVDLGSRSCIPCKKMAPILEGLAKEYRGKASVLFVDVHEDQATAQEFRIQMIPTQIFFNSKGKEVKRHIGFLEKAEIVRYLQTAGLK